VININVLNDLYRFENGSFPESLQQDDLDHSTNWGSPLFLI